MVIRKKILAAVLAATLTIGSAMPVMAAQTVAMTKEKGTWETEYAYNLATKQNYIGEIPEDADYSQGIYVMDNMGQIHLAADKDHIYVGGFGMDGQYYDPDGNRMNAMEYIRRKYYPKYANAGEEQSIAFRGKTDMTLFVYWYEMEYASGQGVTYNYTYHNGSKEVYLKKSELSKYPTDFGEEYQSAIVEDAGKIDNTKPFTERVMDAVELTNARFTYDRTYTMTDINQALADGKGVCFHYAKYLHGLLEAMGLESGYEVGSMDYAEDPSNMHVWNTVKDPETGKTYYADATFPINSKLLLEDPFIYLSRYTPAGVGSGYVGRVGEEQGV